MLDQRTALYRAYDASGTLLYVGISTNPKQRWIEHAASKKWWAKEVHRKTVDWFDTRAEAGRAEAAAVRAERPTRNLALPSEDGSSSFRLLTPRPPLLRSPKLPPRLRRAAPSSARAFSTTRDLWKRFGDAVEASDDAEADMSKVLRQFVRWYVHEAGAKQPDRPAAGPWSKPGSGSEAAE